MNDGFRPKILVITQTPPADSGRGTRMRIGMSVEALSRIGDVSLLLVTQRALAIAEGVPEKYRALCHDRVRILKDTDARAHGTLHHISRLQPKLLASWTHDWVRAPELQDMTGEYDLVWVFRLRMWPVIEQLRNNGMIRSRANILDMDDVESKACYRRTMLMGRSLGRLGFVAELLESMKLRISEGRAARAFDAVLVCSEQDRNELASRITAKSVGVLPNGIRLPESPTGIGAAASLPGKPPVVLFVGSLDFYPNVEGLLWMVDEVLPKLRSPDQHAPIFRLIVVGRSPDKRLQELAAHGAFELHADVPDVAPYYAEANLVVAPIRTGSGTRIKILEAFSFGVPVVATTLGAEGLCAEDQVHLALADTAAEFASRIAELLTDRARAAELSRNAGSLLARRFSLDAICTRVQQIVKSVVPAVQHAEKCL